MTDAIDNLPAATEEAKALSEALRDLETRAERFGTAMTGALTRAVAGGRGLDEILKTTASRLIDIALSAGLKPLQTTVSAGIGTVFDSLASGIAPGGAGRVAAPFSASGGVATPTFLAGRFSAVGSASGSAGSIAAPDGRLAGNGGGGAVAAAVPNVTFNVTARDADSFRRSEGQIAAMLTRTVGRGRRGV